MRSTRRDEPPIPEGIEPAQLDRAARAPLRTLSKLNADRVAEHLVAAGRLLDSDAELSYEHAQAAVARAGRVDVVREAAALAAYATGRYAEALREVRTVRRLSGVDAHRALEADCERGLGRPDRALAVLKGAPEPASAGERLELALVEAGARLDLGEPEAARSVLDRLDVGGLDDETQERLDEVREEVEAALRVSRSEPSDESEPSDPSHSSEKGDRSATADADPAATDDESQDDEFQDDDVIDVLDLGEERP